MKGRSEELHTTLAVCTPVTMDGGATRESIIGKAGTHFMSIEVRGIQSISKIKTLQKDLGSIEGIGKACKEETLHVTMAVLNVEENEEEEMKRKFSVLGDMYQDILHDHL